MCLLNLYNVTFTVRIASFFFYLQEISIRSSLGAYIKDGYFHKFVKDFAERGKAGARQNSLNEGDMASAMSDEEDRSGEAAAGKIPDEFMKVASKITF